MSRAPTPRPVGDHVTALLTRFTLTTAARELVSRFVQADQQAALPLLLDVLELEAQERHERRIKRLRARRSCRRGKPSPRSTKGGSRPRWCVACTSSPRAISSPRRPTS
jgi:hypothetical protein